MDRSFLPSSKNTPPVDERSPWLLEGTSVLLVLLNMALSASLAAAQSPSLAELLGAMFMPSLLALVVVGLASLAKSARTRRARAKIVLGTMIVALLGNFGQLTSRRDAATVPQTEGAHR
jgi:hypothetical protein